MLSIKKCESILNKNRTEKLSIQQVEDVKVLLELYAKQSVEQFKKRKP